jgi:serine/threonine protein kinase/Tol biopolymer transport system component
MSLSSGARLGAYEIVSLVGAGGMGEVYKARDTRLDRTVAIKVLPDTLAGDPEFRERFDREARAISQLTHPHICTLYDVGEERGTAFLVMEYLDGETLADRLAKGALPQHQALTIAIEIASALDKAHRAGIVHRDLKPGNIMLSKSGAKLLDFGLAKASAPVVSGSGASMLPTTPANLTAEGTILGTFQYMAPEQLEGKEADARTDLFAFGAVVYEMVTGKKAFAGKSRVSLISAIMLSDPPPIAASQPLTPPALDHVVSVCLAKDPDGRWQTASDLRRELQWIAQPGSQSSAPSPAIDRRWRRERVAWASVALMLLVLLVVSALVAVGRFREPASVASVAGATSVARVAEVARVQISLPAGSLSFTLSPNGRMVAVVAPSPDGHTRVLWVRAMDSLEPRPLPGTEGALTPPFWSPDSRFIAFEAGGKLKKIDPAGGLPQTICDTSASVLGGAWNRDGDIVFGTGRIMRAPAAGGVATPVTAESPDQFHAFPSFLPDGRHLVYLRFAAQGQGLYLGSLDATPAQQSAERLLDTSVMSTYAPSLDSDAGHLLFMRDGVLLAQAFDARRLALAGEAFPVAERVGIFRLSAYFSTSANGVLAYRSVGTAPSRLVWYGRSGAVLGPAGEQGAYWDVALSPDGTRVATTVDEGRAAGQGISVMELARGVIGRFTFDIAPDFAPAWSPDGHRIAFVATRPGGTGLYQKASSTGGKEQVLLPATSAVKFISDWSRDGHFLLFSSRDSKTKSDLWVLPLTDAGVPAGPAALFLQTEFNERQGQFSPNSDWIAYVSDESGRPEVWVQHFPASSGDGRKTRVSVNGGSQPRWRRDGKELFYVSLDGRLMAADVSTGRSFTAGIPRVLFAAPIQIGDETADTFRWDVAFRGDRFLIDTAATTAEPLTVVLNWTAALRK